MPSGESVLNNIVVSELLEVLGVLLIMEGLSAGSTAVLQRAYAATPMRILRVGAVSPYYPATRAPEDYSETTGHWIASALWRGDAEECARTIHRTTPPQITEAIAREVTAALMEALPRIVREQRRSE